MNVLQFPSRNLLRLLEAVNGVIDGNGNAHEALVCAEAVMTDSGAVQDNNGKWHLPEQSAEQLGFPDHTGAKP